MDVNLMQIHGNWDLGYALDKHTISSRCTGYYPSGQPIFDTLRTDAGEALYQLKYKFDWIQVQSLAVQIVHSIYPHFEDVGFVVPMPPSKVRLRQPVVELAREVGKIIQRPVFENMLEKTPTGQAVKDIGGKVDRLAALAGKIKLNEVIGNSGKWNMMLIDDRCDTGASLETACAMLRTYHKIGRIYVATVTR